MGNEREISFCELRCKEIINVVDGKRLGRAIDIVFEMCGKVCGLVAPCSRRALIFRPTHEIFIPWHCIKKIGEDAILVELGGKDHDREHGRGERGRGHDDRGKDHKGGRGRHPDCDGRCDKCMFFDCGFRWKRDLDCGPRGRAKAFGEQDYKEYYGQEPETEK